MAMVDRNVFVSYCHEDDAWLTRLKVHLRPLIRQGVVDVWDDTRISPGLTWQEEITNARSRRRVSCQCGLPRVGFRGQYRDSRVVAPSCQGRRPYPASRGRPLPVRRT